MTLVSVRPQILSRQAQRIELADGMTLAEIAANVPDLPIGFFDGLGVITISGHVIPPDKWQRVRPKGGTREKPVIIEMHVVPAGGRMLQIFASVALIGLSLAASAFLGPWAGAIVGIAGSLLLHALFPPSKPKTPRDAISAGFGGNPMKPNEIFETVAGKVRAPPPFLAPPYTYYDGNDLYGIAVVGYCGDLQISDIWVNGTDISQNEGIIEYYTQEASGGPISFNDGAEPLQTVIEDRTAVTLNNFHLQSGSSKHKLLYDQSNPSASIPKWSSFRMRGPGSEARFRLFWPGGIEDSNGGVTLGTPFRMQMRITGSATWINLPEFHFAEIQRTAQEYRQNLRFIWQADPGLGAADYTPDTDVMAWVAIWHAAPGRGIGNSHNFEWTADSYFDSGNLYAAHISKDAQGFNVYLDPSLFPIGEYEFRIKRGLAYNLDNFSLGSSTYSYFGSVYRARFFESESFSAPWNAVEYQDNKSSAVQVESFSTWAPDYPLPAQTDVPMSLIAIKCRNVQISSISAVFTSRAYIWNGADWLTYTTTQNPAALYRLTRTSGMLVDPLTAASLDDAALAAWYSFCAVNTYECGAVVGDALDKVLATICTAGHAVPRESETAGVIWEHDRSTDIPVQIFTPLNSANAVASKPFDDLPHGIYAEFKNEQKDYDNDTRVIYGDGYDATNATRFDTVTYESITDPDQIDLRAQLDWRQMFYRQRQLSLEVGAEHLMSMRGDLVAVAHDVIGGTYAWGVVDSVMLDSGGTNVAGLRLQAPLDLTQFGGAGLGVALRYSDGSVVEKAIAETTDSATVTFTTPFAIPAGGILAEGCIVAAGVMSTEYNRMLILDIKPSTDLRAQLTLVDEAPQINAGASGPGGPLTLDFSINYNSQYLGVI